MNTVTLDAPDECVRCGEQLKAGAKVAWFEFRCVPFAPRLPGEAPIPEDESQGCFPMGAACARRVLAKGWDR